MPVEMRLEDAGTAPGPERAEPRESARAAGTGPAVLRDLIAARLVTHEAIGDPARLGPEPAALRALCGLVAGPVYRLEPFHYAFAARETDLGGALAGRAPGERTAALGAALAAALGPEAVWLGAIDLATEAPETARPKPRRWTAASRRSRPGSRRCWTRRVKSGPSWRRAARSSSSRSRPARSRPARRGASRRGWGWRLRNSSPGSSGAKASQHRSREPRPGERRRNPAETA